MTRRLPLLDRIDIPSPCTADWDSMTGAGSNRFCEQCSRSVHDLSSMTKRQAEGLVRRSGGRLCVRILRDVNGRVSSSVQPEPRIQRDSLQDRIATAPPPLRVSRATASAMAIALLTAMQVSAQGLPPSAIVSSDRTGAASGVGAIRGSVKDETGACIAGAEVLLCGLAEGGVTVRADEAGQFTFEGVPAAGYRLRVSAAGFRSFETPTLVVNGSETEVVDTVLSVGMGGEIVVVGNSRAFCHVWKFNPDAIDVESQHVLPGPALLTAIDRGEKRLREALDAGASPNELFAFGRTPLMHAADNEDLVRLLLERGADPTLRDEAGATALHYAALADDGATVFALCRAGCDPNVADFEGITPLIVAALDGNEDAVSALVAAGANVHARDVGGRSALDYAREEEREEVIEILEVAGAK